MDPAAGWTPWALNTVETDGDQIVALTSYLDTATLYPRFGLPAHLRAA